MKNLEAEKARKKQKLTNQDLNKSVENLSIDDCPAENPPSPPNFFQTPLPPKQKNLKSNTKKSTPSKTDKNNNQCQDFESDSEPLEYSSTRKSTRLVSGYNELAAKLGRKSIPSTFEPPSNPVQSTPAKQKSIPVDDRFNTPAVPHHYGQNTVIQVDGEIASFNNSDYLDASAKRLAVLEAHVDDDIVKKNVRERLDLSTIYEDVDEHENAERNGVEHDDTVVFESKCGDKPVTTMVQVLEKKSLAITTTVGGAEPSQRPAVVDVVDIEDDGKIQVYRKFMAAENWKNLTEEEQAELVNWIIDQVKFEKSVRYQQINISPLIVFLCCLLWICARSSN